MRASRLLSILILLQLNARTTAHALAEKFDVSIRTIYRDIDELSAAGIPVFSERGPGGGFQLQEKFRSDLTGLTLDEASALLMLGAPMAHEALGLSDSVTHAQTKLFASLTPDNASRAAEIRGLFHLDPMPWYFAAESVPFLPLLARAAMDAHAVALRYKSWKGERDWTINPLGIVLKTGIWYVIGWVPPNAYGPSAMRTLRVSNIGSAAALKTQPFSRPPEFDLETVWRESVERFETQLRSRRATVRATGEGCRRLKELGAYAAQAVNAAGVPRDDGWRTFEIAIESDAQTARAFLSIGAEIEVVSPASLREEIHRVALRVANAHQD
jgi:predicted DNA-binding transcriptional regulator YafY